ncbi:MAG: hypothetical protein F4138_04555 [Acidimicrobiia bacterium]|nr:hypothetical protein [Acidimicrobiia bacterium]MYC58491.1 hypothetical protein [Acidimicrobiia bacterium]MYG94249.1 hypothetical protein [Acidimicrobiia bacterium]MYI30403.1 hypothetical protein [Acidimicrobiia bacterium]
MPDPLAYLRRQTLTRGVANGSRIWLVLGCTAWAIRIIRRAVGTKKLKTVLSEELPPAQSLVITHLSDNTK